MKAGMIPNFIKRAGAALFACALAWPAISGCGKKTEPVPELIAPPAAMETYRPVAKRVVDPVKILHGEVVPKDYPVFSTKPVDLGKILVAPGDYVEEGDVIALAGIPSEEAEEIRNRIASLEREKTWKKLVSDKNLERLEYEKNASAYLQDDWGANTKAKEIAVEQENQRYEQARINSEIKAAKTELDDLLTKEGEKTFTAPHAGYVTFVRDTASSNRVDGLENIAVISDFEDLLIECADVNIKDYEYADYRSKWIEIRGERIPIREVEYSAQEISYALSSGRNPYVSFTADTELVLGTDLALRFQKGEVKEKPVVGNDSIIRENGQTFVYVKKDGGADEKRTVVLGATDGLYTEVFSGVSEGEKVLYQNDALIPVEYEVGSVAYSDYEVITTTKQVEDGLPRTDIYLAECNGKFHRIADTGNVAEGDELFSVKSEKGNADVEAIRIAITDLDKDREKQHKDYEKAKKRLIDALVEVPAFDPVEMQEDPGKIQASLFAPEITRVEEEILDYTEEYQRQEYEAGRKKLQRDYARAQIGVGETGYTVTAPSNGRTGAFLENGSVVAEGSFLMALRTKREDDFYVFAGMGAGEAIIDGSYHKKAYSARLGEPVVLTSGDKTWNGTCVGRNGDSERYMLFTKDGKQYATWSRPFDRNQDYQMYFKLDKEISEEERTGSELSYDGVKMEGVVTLPKSAVKTETDRVSKATKYFVWKMENEEMVKEFITPYEVDASAETIYVLNGVKPGDQILDDHIYHYENNQ